MARKKSKKRKAKTKLLQKIWDPQFWAKEGNDEGKIYELDELGWGCCIVNNSGGIYININKHDKVLLELDQLKTLLDHAENVEESMEEYSIAEKIEKQSVLNKKCKCGKMTNTAVCNWINSKDDKADKCYVAYENNKWIKGCAFDEAPDNVKNMMKELLGDKNKKQETETDLLQKVLDS